MLVAEEFVAAARRARPMRRPGCGPVGGEAFEPRVGRDVARRVDAHHRGRDEERGLERRRVAAVRERLAILHIHEDVGADLQLGEDTPLGIEIERAGAAAGDDRHRDPRRAQPRQHRRQARDLRQRAGAALGAHRECAADCPNRIGCRGSSSPRRERRAHQRRPAPTSSATPVRPCPASKSTSTSSVSSRRPRRLIERREIRRDDRRRRSGHGAPPR